MSKASKNPTKGGIRRKNRWRPLRLAVGVLLLAFWIVGAIPVSASESRVITITTNSDINPFIRVPLYSSTFKSGGPFTIRCEVNVVSFSKTKTDGNIFYNITDNRDETQQNVWMNAFSKKTDGWIEMVDYQGEYITFNNINKVLISGVFEDFALFQMGVYYGKATVAFRNFRILNAAGEVVYSWDTDPNLNGITNLKDAPPDGISAETFGDGSADILVSNEMMSGSTSSSGDYEDETSTTSRTDTISSVSDSSSVEDTGTTTSSGESEPRSTGGSVTGLTTSGSSADRGPTTAGASPKDESPSAARWVIPVAAVCILAAGAAVVLILMAKGKIPNPFHKR